VTRAVPRPAKAPRAKPSPGRAKSAPALQIDVVVRSARWKKQPGAATIVRKAVAAAALAASTPAAELAIVLTHDSAIRVLNRDWRGFDKPTNVLSFAAPQPRGRNGPLGDIVIAYETAAREAKDEGKPLRHHLAHLAVHGFLHLIGYDHETDRDARKMERFETDILAGLRVPDPYAAFLPHGARGS
jgi:probable rRNA maturation factor